MFGEKGGGYCSMGGTESLACPNFVESRLKTQQASQVAQGFLAAATREPVSARLPRPTGQSKRPAELLVLPHTPALDLTLGGFWGVQALIFRAQEGQGLVFVLLIYIYIYICVIHVYIYIYIYVYISQVNTPSSAWLMDHDDPQTNHQIPVDSLGLVFGPSRSGLISHISPREKCSPL